MELYPIYTNFERKPLTKNWQAFFKDSRNRLRKQEEEEAKETETVKPSPTLQDNKVDAKAILDVIKEISETLETHAGIIEDLSDRVERLEQKQPSQGAVKRDAITGRIEPSELDLEVIQSRFEAVGLCGEVKRILPFEVIN